jgi:hypothetical protein
MSSSNNNSNPIQDTENENQDTNTDDSNSYTTTDSLNSIASFFTSLLWKVLFLFLVLFFGTGILYSAKVSQSNILPTDIHCFPYESNDTNIKTIPINRNVTSIKGEKYSQKIYFPFEGNNRKNFVLDYLRKIKESPNTTGTYTYLVEVLMTLIQLNYYFINTFYHLLNTYSSESFILFLGPPLLFLSFLVFCLLNFFSYGYAWFSNLSWLFEENTNIKNEGKPTWQSVNLLQPFNYFLSWFLFFLFILLFFLTFLFIYPILTTFSLFYALLTPLGLTGFMKINNVFQKVSFFQFFKDTMNSKKEIIMILFSIAVFLSSFLYFDLITCCVLFFIFILFWFQVIPNNLYVSFIPENLSKMTSYLVAERTCTSNQGQGQGIKSKDIWNIFKDNKQKGGLMNEMNGQMNGQMNGMNGQMNGQMNGMNGQMNGGNALFEPLKKLAKKLQL